MKEKELGTGKLVLNGLIVSVLMAIAFAISEFITLKIKVNTFFATVILLLPAYLVFAIATMLLKKKLDMDSRALSITRFAANSFYMVLLAIVLMIFKATVYPDMKFMGFGVALLFIVMESISLIVEIVLLVAMLAKITKINK